MTNFNQSKILASRLLQGSAIVGLAAMWATGAMAQAANSGNTQVAETIETVTVTGTAIRGIIAPVGDNVITVDRDTIEATGANNVEQLLTTIPSVTGFGNPGQGGFGSADGSGTNAPTIHSLGASASNSTLILVDDHRIPLSGLAHSLSDPSTIPTIALQRVEVLADGASSIYGSDAVAGVINFITRRNYEGAETDVEYGDGLNYNQFTASQIIGTRWDHGSFMAAYQYSSNSQLLGSDRGFVNDNQTFRGLSNLGNFAGDPATIASTSSSAVYPYPYTAGTGVTNTQTSALYGQARYSSLLPSENRNAALVNVTEDVSDWLTVSAQLNWSSRIDDLAVGRNPGAGQGTGGTGVTATVYGPGAPAANAAQINPFYVPVPGSASGVETIRIDFNPILGPGAFTKSGTTVAYAAPEADIKLGGDWLATISGVAGATSSFSRTVGQVCASCVYLGLNGTTNSGGSPTQSSIPVVLGTSDITTRIPLNITNALNVWGAAGSAAAGGANTSAAVLAQLTDNNSLSQTNQNMNELNIKAGGTLFNDGAGEVRTSFGGEYRNYGIYQYTVNNDAAGPSTTNSSDFSAKFGRSVYAAYAEFLIPVVSPAWNIPLVKSVDIDISGRYDHYSDVGDTKNPKVGIDWDIIDGLKARGSYSTSFVAPALTSTGGIAGLTTESNVGYGTGTGGPATVPPGYANNGGGTGINCAAGCTVGNATNQGITIAGPGGATVKPETGTAYSAGLDFDAGKFWNIFHGLTGNVTYWQDKLVGAITSPVMTLDTQITSLNKNLIINPSAAQITAAYLIPGVRVASVVAGPVTFLQYYTQQNAFNLWANGIDFTVNYAFQPNDSWGLFNVGLDGSQKLRFDQQGGGFGGAIVNNLNKNANTTFSSLAFLGRGSLGWQLDSFSSNLFVNYTESYYEPTTSVPFTAAGYFRVPAYVTVDMTLAYSLPEGMFPFSGGTQLYLTGDDLFNQGPPPYNNATGYDASDASPLGRLVLIGLRKKW